MSTTAAPQTIAFINGLWMTPLSWEKWVEHFEGRGHRVLAPAWPGFDRDIEDVRRDPKPYEEVRGRSHFLVGANGWEEVADYALDRATAHAIVLAAAA